MYEQRTGSKIMARLSAIEVILLVNSHPYGYGLSYANDFSFPAQAAPTPHSWKFPKRVSSEPSRRKQQHTAPGLKNLMFSEPRPSAVSLNLGRPAR